MEFSPVDDGSVGVILLTFLVQSLFQFCTLIFVPVHVPLRVANILKYRVEPWVEPSNYQYCPILLGDVM